MGAAVTSLGESQGVCVWEGGGGDGELKSGSPQSGRMGGGVLVWGARGGGEAGERGGDVAESPSSCLQRQ